MTLRRGKSLGTIISKSSITHGFVVIESHNSQRSGKKNFFIKIGDKGCYLKYIYNDVSTNDQLTIIGVDII